MLERTESEWGPWTIVEATDRYWRSEEHTSELQSLRHLVCRLLLEKKKGTHRCGLPGAAGAREEAAAACHRQRRARFWWWTSCPIHCRRTSRQLLSFFFRVPAPTEL